MKKCYYSLMVMLMALVSVGVTSCSDDDEPDASDIVGTWRVDNSDWIGLGATWFQFTKDGKFHEIDKPMSAPINVLVYHGTYTLSGNVLSITCNYEHGTTTVDFIYKVKGNKMTITNNDGYTQKLIRVEDIDIEPYL